MEIPLAIDYEINASTHKRTNQFSSNGVGDFGTWNWQSSFSHRDLWSPTINLVCGWEPSLNLFAFSSGAPCPFPLGAQMLLLLAHWPPMAKTQHDGCAGFGVMPPVVGLHRQGVGITLALLV